ncbi:MAG: DNA-formamidopyrimidine glycosylase [Bacilli bacterium]|nr:DNA-formamidopyrimidine glycosylase [Bacilli bacterium]MDD4282357.1 DNA-formamidopyrimidine glycosylase [Bacilli bacterium]
MPELPEVETVKETLKRQILNNRIVGVKVHYAKTIEFPSVEEFKKQIINQTFIDIKRRGKWLMFELNDYYLLSHLRMEGKYNIKDIGDELDKHEHVVFTLDNNKELRYKDVRKFGKMHLILKDDIYNRLPLKALGLEPNDKELTVKYLKDKYKNKSLPIKTVLLDQQIIVGIGNIYADEILFLSSINPLKQSKKLTKKELQLIIDNTKIVLEKAIKAGGTTIRSYTSSEGVHGKFQHELLVHGKEGKPCPKCNDTIVKIKVGGRGTYYCRKCQK